jgi:hypothetical protein
MPACSELSERSAIAAGQERCGGGVGGAAAGTPYGCAALGIADDKVSETIAAERGASTAVIGAIAAESPLLHDRIAAWPATELWCIGQVVVFPTQHAAILQATSPDRWTVKSAREGVTRSATASRCSAACRTNGILLIRCGTTLCVTTLYGEEFQNRANMETARLVFARLGRARRARHRGYAPALQRR